MVARTAALAALVLTGALISTAPCQEKSIARKGDPAIYNAMRDVINTGADLFNLQSDYLGCYRLYQGSLIAIKPLLKPEVQAVVQKAMIDAESRPTFAEKANQLRKVIDIVREETKPPTPVDPPPPAYPPRATAPLPPEYPLPPPVFKTPKTPEAEIIRTLPKKVS